MRVFDGGLWHRREKKFIARATIPRIVHSIPSNLVSIHSVHSDTSQNWVVDI